MTADDDTYTLMAAYSEWIRKIGTHQIVGWYHSHPSYGCWLSGIDVNTQERFQKNADPFLAIVVDPIKSVNLRKRKFMFRKGGYGGVQSISEWLQRRKLRKRQRCPQEESRRFRLPLSTILPAPD